MKLKIISVAIGVVLVAVIAVFGSLCRVREVDIVFSESVDMNKADEIYTALETETGASIIAVNENDLIRRINAAYPDRSVVVTDIIRSFPDKVTVYIDLNEPIFAVPRMTGDGYQLADKDFQLNLAASESDLDKSRIVVISGVNVGNSFDLPVFSSIRGAVLGLNAAGLSDDGIVALLSEISIENGDIIFKTRSGAAFRTSLYPSETLGDRAGAAYSEYAAGR